MFKSIKENRGRLLAQRKKGVRFSVFDATEAHGRTPMPTASLAPAITPMHASDAETPNASKAAELNTGSVCACDYAVFDRKEPFVVYMTKMKPYYVLMSTKVPCAPREEVFFPPRRINPCKICCTMGACNPLLHTTGVPHRVSRPADENLSTSQFNLSCVNYWDALEMHDGVSCDFDCTELYSCFSRDPNTNRRRQPHELHGYYAGGPVRASGDYAFYPNRRFRCPYSVDMYLHNKPGRRIRSHDHRTRYNVQSLEEHLPNSEPYELHTDPVSEVAEVMDMVKCVHKQLADVVESGLVPEDHVKLVEDLLIFSYSVYRSRDFYDFSLAVVVLFKLRTNGSVIGHLMNILKGLCGSVSGQYDVQSNTGFTWFMDALKSDTYKEIVRVLTILCGLFMMFGNSQFNLDIFDKCERTFKFSPVISGTNIFVDIVSTLSSIYSKFVAFVESGDVNDFFDTNSNVRDFCDRVYNVDRVAKNFPMMTTMCNVAGDKWTFHTFAYELHCLLDRAPHIRAVTRGSSNFVKENINKKIQTLNEANEAFEVFLNSQKFRPAPFSLLVYGGTSIGKSTIVRLIQELYAKMVGLPSGQEYCYTLNPHDKYMSGYGMFHHTLVLDDIAVSHPKKLAEGDPQLNFLMRVVNNVTFVAPQADVESKGKIPVKVELVIGTTNVKDLTSHAHFNVPSAVLRRFPFVVSPEVLPRFAVVNGDGSLGTRLDPARVDGSNDYYSWTVESVIPDGKNVRYETVLNKGTLADFVKWMDANVDRHKNAQKLVMESSENFVNIPTCSTCGKIEMICVCHCSGCGKNKPECSCEPELQSDETPYKDENVPNTEASFALAFRGFALGFFLSSVFLFLTMAIQFMLDTLIFHVSQIYYTMSFMLRTYDFCHKIVDNINNRFLQCWITVSRTSQRFVRRTRASYRRSMWSLATFWQGWHFVDNQYTVPVILSIISAGAIGYHLYSRRRKYEQQGNGGSKPQMFEADGEADKKNFYVSNLSKGFPIEMSQASRATSSCNVNDVRNMIIGNLHHVTIVANHTYAKANALFVMDNYLVLNNHVLLSDECVIKFDSNPGRIRPLPDTKVMPDMVYRIPDIDICVIRLASLPKRRDISKFLLREEPKPDGDLIFSGHMFRMPLPTGTDDDLRNPEVFKILSAKFCHINAKARNDKKLVDRGFKCQLDKETKSGYCGSVSVFNMDSEGNGLIIAGLHHAASGRDTITAPLTYDRFMEAYQALNDRSVKDVNKIVGWNMEASIINPPIGHDVCRLGSEHRDVHLKPLHPKCPLHWFNDGVFMPIGSHDGIRDSNLRSRVKDFPLREDFEQLGYSSQKVAPELTGWEIHRKALLETVSDNSMSEDILSYVTAAYIKDIIARVPPKEFAYLKPLDDYSSINGVANYSYIDSIVMSTSAGWPFSQKKINYFQMCEPRDGHQFAYEPIPELQRRIDNIYAAYAEGKRSFVIWKAFTKDEPISQTKFDEHRTRHLFCSPVDFSIVTRKYTLTLARLMQRNQFAFETAMGIVAQSSEWTTLYKYLTAHPNNIFGDYVSYDKTMTLCVMRSVFLIIKTLCYHSGNYTPDDIRAISCIEEDTACPLVDFFGDLIMFSGINPSGSPLTTMINCLANCLYMRYAFVICAENVSLPRELVLDFRKHINLITYGDDNGMCVSDHIPWFTHNNLKLALKSVGVGYTTPDKDKDGCVDYLDISKVDFLSRGFVYNADIDGFLAPLSDKSMSKMVCHYLKSGSIPEITQVLSILRAFVFESFFQGREIYERNLTFCQSVVKTKYDIYENYPTWDEQVEEWKCRSVKFARIEI